VALPVVLGWSGGKDSTLALAQLLQDDRYEVAGLITTVTEEYDRVSIHGVRRQLLRRQVEALGLEVVVAPLSPGSNNAQYEASFRAAVAEWKRRVPALTHLAFGDLFLADIRAYRERVASEAGCTALFPVWGVPTDQLARRFIADGYMAHLVCVDDTKLDSCFAGRAFDTALLMDLPTAVDPCGENGEFHTFVSAGPIFRPAVAVRLGESVRRDGCTYADLLPASSGLMIHDS
jgi:uncharacterized protein (TIGR00290 family)